MLSLQEIERMNIEEANHSERVLYTPTQVTSQACRPEDLILIPEAPSPYIVKTFIDGKIENTPIGEQ